MVAGKGLSRFGLRDGFGIADASATRAERPEATASGLLEAHLRKLVRAAI